MTRAWMSFIPQFPERNQQSLIPNEVQTERPPSQEALCIKKKKSVCVYIYVYFSLFPRSSFCKTSSAIPSFALTYYIIAEGKLCYGVPQLLEPTQLNGTTIPFNTRHSVQGHIKIGPVRLTKMVVDFISLRLVV